MLVERKRLSFSPHKQSLGSLITNNDKSDQQPVLVHRALKTQAEQASLHTKGLREKRRWLALR
jgi:hypothetical protein